MPDADDDEEEVELGVGTGGAGMSQLISFVREPISLLGVLFRPNRAVCVT